MADLKALTAVYSFPYPLAGDSVQNTPTRIKELADRIEATYSTLGIDLSGSTLLMQDGDAAGGDLTGTYPNPTIAASKITSSNIVDATIVGGDIASATITGANIGSSIVLAGAPTTTTPDTADSSTKITTTAHIQAVAANFVLGVVSTGSVTSAMILDGTLVNADINAEAAIAYTKLSLALSILNADISASAAIAYSKLALTGAILDADISASAAIAYSKLALTGAILDADINSAAGIVDTKLATISTASKVSNSATTAASANTPSTIVARDASGNFTAGTITATLAGNATSATTAKWG